MSFIAKVALTGIQDNGATRGKTAMSQSQLVTFKPVTEHSDVPEDKDFSKWSPTQDSSIVLHITNLAVLQGLAIGQRYYVTFEPVPEGK